MIGTGGRKMAGLLGPISSAVKWKEDKNAYSSNSHSALPKTVNKTTVTV